MPQPPSPNPVRRNARVGVVTLPAEGRKGPTPAWPLPGGMDGFEEQVWRELWATPQAVAWERFGWTRVVARYCRVLVEAEQRSAKASSRNQASLLEDKLGMTPKAMRLLLWQIASDEVGEKREEQPPAESPRKRFKAVS